MDPGNIGTMKAKPAMYGKHDRSGAVNIEDQNSPNALAADPTIRAMF